MAQKFGWSKTIITTSGDYPLMVGCFAWMVVNISGVGGPVFYVDGCPVHAALVAGANGEHHAVSGQPGMVVDALQRSLQIQIGPAGSVPGQLFLRQLYTIDCE